MPPSPADWQLPAGVSRGVWEYVQDAALAEGYDESLAGSTLCRADLAFVERFCRPPGSLLDLGCGSGRLLAHCAGLGYRVVGVDLSEPMLRAARDKTRGRAGVHFVKATIADLGGFADEVFDHVACLFSTLGMVAGPAHREAVLRHALRVVRPDGRLVLHVHNRWFHVWTPGGRRWILDDLIRRWRSAEDAGDWAMPAHRGISGLALHHFSRRETLGLLARTGWRVVHVEPVGLGIDGRLGAPWWLGSLRAYGYLVAAERPRR